MELILFIIIIGVALAGLLSVYNTSVRASADPMPRKQALAIAESLLEEVLLQEFANPPGGYSGTDRSRFDDVSDYAGFSMSGISALDGTPVAGLSGFSASVAVVAAAFAGVPATDALLVTVTVTAPDGSGVSLSGIRTKS